MVRVTDMQEGRSYLSKAEAAGRIKDYYRIESSDVDPGGSAHWAGVYRTGQQRRRVEKQGRECRRSVRRGCKNVPDDEISSECDACPQSSAESRSSR
ncbi:hypothetical protein GCM10009661_50030 [Catellatospora chokoriensis]|uniref:Uncharacterized protein n=1 Tax=Catellatospora chokoriensis TaxID=310353 RepID=A0A8J3KDC4_9ACTN|nr:hypothetical protein Cch02nite_73330 [Catellatospora chokoriensis]